MRVALGYVLYLLAILITAAVVASKYFGVTVPNVTELVMRDPAQSLVIALLLALVSKWL
jgi:hypothetical protein